MQSGEPSEIRKQGYTVFITGLPSSGKTTVAELLAEKLSRLDSRVITVLDGDKVRQQLSSELLFSKEHRDLNVRRIGYVASLITKTGGTVICSLIAPYDSARKEVRTLIQEVGGFSLIHVATPLVICERRDVKGLYARARANEIRDFTGVSAPYEIPTDAEVVLTTTDRTAEECTDEILSHLLSSGYIRACKRIKVPILHPIFGASLNVLPAKKPRYSSL